MAFGSEPFFSPTLPHEENTIISIDEISKLEKLPEKVLVLGSGKWGAEAAIGFQGLGCKVFFCTESVDIFPELDPETIEDQEACQDVSFSCKCSKKRSVRALKLIEKSELINARVAMIGFLMLILTELAFAGEPATQKIFGIN